MNQPINQQQAANTETPTVSKVVLVGHCGFDSTGLRRAVEQALPGSAVVSVNTGNDLDQYATPESLWLVNRVLDGRFGSGWANPTGIELIADFAKRGDAPRMLLVSNYEDSQREAVAAGALEGFGKNDLGSPRCVALMRSAAGAQATEG